MISSLIVLLGISSSILPFNIFQIRAQEKSDEKPALKLIKSDRAVFRVDGKVYFSEDLKPFLRYLDQFRCLYLDSKIVSQLKLTKSEEPTLKVGKNKRIKSALRMKILKLLKILVYVKNQTVVVRPEVEDLMLTAAHQNNCLPKKRKKIPAKLKEFMKAEIFLRSRFKGDNIWITKEEINSFSKSHSLSPEVAEARLRDLKVNQSLGNFIQSLFDQVGHRGL